MLKNKNLKIFLFLIIAAMFLVTFFAIKNNRSSESTSDNKKVIAEDVNLDPPSEEDIKRAEDNKETIIEKENQLTSSTGSPKVTPIISYAGQYGDEIEVGAYVNGIFEDGGTCLASFKNGSTTITKSVSAIKNAKSVDCPVMSENVSSIAKGMWTVSVSYKSPAHSGVSEEKQIEVK